MRERIAQWKDEEDGKESMGGNGKRGEGKVRVVRERNMSPSSACSNTT